MGRPRVKRMGVDEFELIARREWVPVVLAGDARPDWMGGVPEERVEFVLASGTFVDPRVIETQGVTYSGVVGGLDVYRRDEQDTEKGYPFNKDHYMIVRNAAKQEYLLVVGPIRDDEHWLARLPEVYPEIEILEFKGAVAKTDETDQEGSA